MSFIPDYTIEDKNGDTILVKERFSNRLNLYGKYPSNYGDEFYHTISKTHMEKGLKRMVDQVNIMKKLLKG